jgi:hypothetical protein
MGSFFAAKNYILSLAGQDFNIVYQGVGLLPINISCHWDVETKKEEKIDLLRESAPELPILTLDECKFSTFIY